MSQREELLQMMTKLLNSATKIGYKSGYQALKRYCTVNENLSFFCLLREELEKLPCHVGKLCP
ncbi:hypothetical protein L916_19872 [Phytophthora nicotianae]|uniref:Transposase n=1 Tax=Phytophthora nicotianae TaxID=4792 RepID=W2HWX5_PHYNI|nr:hypothetical protein L916_19872 [Phytophthora nicotianae]